MQTGSKILRKVNKRKRFNILLSVREIEGLLDRLPEDDEVFKFLSTGGFSAISFIRFVARRTVIRRLTVSTLRVGKKEMQSMNVLHSGQRLDRAEFIIGSFMKNDSKTGRRYGYYDLFEQICRKNGWAFAVAQNHSKLLLFNTDAGKFVIETSSNLNENPKMEQFSFERSTELYEFYLAALEPLLKGGSEFGCQCEIPGEPEQTPDQPGEECQDDG